MSGARGRPAQDSAEKQGSTSKSEEQAMRSSNATLTAATATALAGTGFAAMGMAKLAESGAGDVTDSKRTRKISKERAKERAAKAAKRTARATSGGGGGLYVTPDAATGRDVTKRFKRN